ncbi:hypothetical protein [Thalassospira aquimaris]|uniref:Uncharacterized protein n=1 Tax=Thalassospira aquimaris TaxID=3037796 RepID=A0ABT6GGG6_9PROT|nr:hypothetical protein [Thalassospira sp. FZY0004]MDG4721175.1 hypothetical protein [Thalassospira sp. FZY0004]
MKSTLFKSEAEKTEFVEITRAGIAADKTPAMIRCDLSERFDFETLTVCNALSRCGISLFETRTGLRGMRDIDAATKQTVIDRCKELIAEGKGPLRIRAMLSIEFDLYEVSAVSICLRHGNIDIRTEAYRGNTWQPSAARQASEVEDVDFNPDYDPDEDITLKAVDTLREKQKDVRFDKKRGQWWLNHRPVSRVQLIQSAGLGV